MSSSLEGNKQTVREFCDLAFNQKQPAEAASRYLGTTYRQHNPMAGDGVKSFVAFITGFVNKFPQLRVALKRLVAEGDLVAVHSHFVRNPGDRGVAAMDIFRLENGRIVEHWDVLQDVPEISANANTMF